MKRAIIVGATSGIGREVAVELLRRGWTVGAAGRRADRLESLQAIAPERVMIQTIDVTEADAPERLMQLIERMGGMELYLHSSGIGRQNRALDPAIELPIFDTNTTGFGRMVIAAFNYFGTHGGGHLAAITSVAGTKGMGSAPAYSATKRFQRNYLEALAQLATIRHTPICITDIRPGFVDTAILTDPERYPMLMKPDAVARSIVDALDKRRPVVTIDWRYALLAAIWRIIPRWAWVRMRLTTKPPTAGKQ